MLKNTNPVKVTEFTMLKGIAEKPTLAWWLPYTILKRDRIISSVNTCVYKTNHKYCLEIPFTLDNAKQIDKEIG